LAVLDTNLLIDLLRRKPAQRTVQVQILVRAILLSGESIMTTRLNIAELYVGAELSSDPRGEQTRIDKLLEPFQILEFDEASGRAYGQIQATLRRTGRPAGDMDALIAAVAMTNGQTLFTRNDRHFRGIPGLAITAVT